MYYEYLSMYHSFSNCMFVPEDGWNSGYNHGLSVPDKGWKSGYIVGWTQVKHFDNIHIENMSNSIIAMYGNAEVTPAVVSWRGWNSATKFMYM